MLRDPPQTSQKTNLNLSVGTTSSTDMWSKTAGDVHGWERHASTNDGQPTVKQDFELRKELRVVIQMYTELSDYGLWQPFGLPQLYGILEPWHISATNLHDSMISLDLVLHKK